MGLKYGSHQIRYIIAHSYFIQNVYTPSWICSNNRDVTLQRGTSYISRTDSALREGLVLEEQLNRRYGEMEQMKKVFEAHWSEQIKQVREKQDVFQSQVNVNMKNKVCG